MRTIPNRRESVALRDSTTIAEKAAIALQIAGDRGDAEVEAKYRALDDPLRSVAVKHKLQHPITGLREL